MGILERIFAPNAQATSDRLDAELRRQNQIDYERGQITARELEARERRIAEGSLDVNADLNKDFATGWKEGGDNIRRALGSTIEATTGTFARILPWYVWVIGLGFLIFHFGLHRKILALFRR